MRKAIYYISIYILLTAIMAAIAYMERGYYTARGIEYAVMPLLVLIRIGVMAK